MLYPRAGNTLRSTRSIPARGRYCRTNRSWKTGEIWVGSPFASIIRTLPLRRKGREIVTVAPIPRTSVAPPGVIQAEITEFQIGNLRSLVLTATIGHLASLPV